MSSYDDIRKENIAEVAKDIHCKVCGEEFCCDICGAQDFETKEN